MVRNEFTFPSADGKTAIHAAEWLPETAPRAVLVLSHGVSEHILRYEPFAAFLTERGFAVCGHDHLGHGTSVAEGAPRLYFGPRGSWDDVVRDLYARRELAGKRFPGVPVFLLGHSMGSFLARTYLIRYPGTVAGAVLMGTGQMVPAVLAAARVLAAEEARRVGEDHASPLVTKLAFETYNRRFAPNRTAFDWPGDALRHRLCDQTGEPAEDEPEHPRPLHLRGGRPGGGHGEGRPAGVRGVPPGRRPGRGADAVPRSAP